MVEVMEDGPSCGKVHEKAEVVPVSAESKRICAVFVTLDSCSFILINVYMPCDICVPHIKVKKTCNNITGWHDIIKPFREASIWWHNLWKEMQLKQM